MRTTSATGFSLAMLLAVPIAAAQAPLGSGVTYQGRLMQAGSPADGAYPMEFTLWDDSTGGAPAGPTLSFDGVGGNPPPVDVIDGLFSVVLDFGAGAYNGDARWLEIIVDGVPLTPRQPLTAAPYSVQTRGIHVNAPGNVGIGTSSPTSLLHVSDDDWPTARIDSSSNIGTWLRLNNMSAGGRSWNVISSGAGNGEGAGKLLFNDQSGGGTRMLLTETGDLGIGTTTPVARLTVLRSSGTEEAARFTDFGSSSQLRINVTLFRAELQGWNGSTDLPGVLALNPAGGNVGIGTGNPQDALHVATGAIRFPDNTRQTTAVRVVRTALTLDFGSFGTGTAVANMTVSGAELGGSVSISPNQDLPNGLVLAWARVSAAGVVRFGLRNVTTGAIDPPPITYYTTVINP